MFGRFLDYGASDRRVFGIGECPGRWPINVLGECRTADQRQQQQPYRHNSGWFDHGIAPFLNSHNKIDHPKQFFVTPMPLAIELNLKRHIWVCPIRSNHMLLNTIIIHWRQHNPYILCPLLSCRTKYLLPHRVNSLIYAAIEKVLRSDKSNIPPKPSNANINFAGTGTYQDYAKFGNYLMVWTMIKGRILTSLENINLLWWGTI